MDIQPDGHPDYRNLLEVGVRGTTQLQMLKIEEEERREKIGPEVNPIGCTVCTKYSKYM